MLKAMVSMSSALMRGWSVSGSSSPFAKIKSGGSFFGYRCRHRRLERLVIAAAVDRRHFRSHGAQVRGQGAAVVNAVIVEKSEIEHGRQVEDAEEIDRCQQLFRR